MHPEAGRKAGLEGGCSVAFDGRRYGAHKAGSACPSLRSASHDSQKLPGKSAFGETRGECNNHQGARIIRVEIRDGEEIGVVSKCNNESEGGSDERPQQQKSIMKVYFAPFCSERFAYFDSTYQPPKCAKNRKK